MTTTTPIARPNATPNNTRSPQKGSAEPNVLKCVLGDVLIRPWYPSFYPEELVGRKTEWLYVCKWCFKYSKELMPFLGHIVSAKFASAHVSREF